MRKLLFSRKSECIQPLRCLIEKQTHKTLVLWALDCAHRFLKIFEKDFPNDTRPKELIDIAWLWAKGEVKMPIAKKAIHAAHNAATDAESFPAAQAAARAIGHAAATIHVETHGLGLVFYGLTALVYSETPDNIEEFTIMECEWFEDTGFPYAVQSCRCSNCRYVSEGKCSLKECCCMAERVRAHTCMICVL